MPPSDPSASAAADARTQRRRWLVRTLLAAAVLTYAGSGIYFVRPDERGVVRIGGRLVGKEVEPGLHYAPPWPLGRVDKPRTTEVRRVIIGLTPEDQLLIDAGDTSAILASPQTDVLTGDTNILKVTLVVQYQVTDAARYVLRTVDPDNLVRQATQVVMVQYLSRLPVDAALTTAKIGLRNAIMQHANQMLARYDTGVTLASASVQNIGPPLAVGAAFNDVTSAQYDREKQIERARNTADQMISNARGRASETIAAAEAEAQQRIAQARGDAAAFAGRLREYRRAPQLTRTRLLLATLEEALRRVRKVVVDEADGRHPVELKLLEGTAAPPAAAH